MEKTENSAMWETIRTLWASGRYATIGALHRKCVELYADQAPTIGSLRRTKHRELWDNDAALQEEISEESKKTASQILSELGMGMSRSLELLTEIIRAPHEDHDRIKSILDALFKGQGGEIDPKAVAGALRDLKALYSKGMEISLKALVIAMQYHQGGKIGDKSETGDGSTSDATPEEIRIEIEQIIKSMGYEKKSGIEAAL